MEKYFSRRLPFKLKVQRYEMSAFLNENKMIPEKIITMDLTNFVDVVALEVAIHKPILKNFRHETIDGLTQKICDYLASNVNKTVIFMTVTGLHSNGFGYYTPKYILDFFLEYNYHIDEPVGSFEWADQYEDDPYADKLV